MERLSRRESNREVICEGKSRVPKIYKNEAHYYKHMINDNAYMWEFVKRMREKSFHQAHAMVINSFDNLEGLALMSLSNQLDLPIHRVSPLVEPL